MAKHDNNCIDGPVNIGPLYHTHWRYKLKQHQTQ